MKNADDLAEVGTMGCVEEFHGRVNGSCRSKVVGKGWDDAGFVYPQL